MRQAHKSCRVKWSGMACGLVVSLTGTRESKVAKHDWWKKPLFHPFLDDATISCLDVTLKSWWWLLQGQSFRRGKLSALFGVAWKCMNERSLRSPLWSSPSTSKSSHCQWILLLQLSNWHIIYYILFNQILDESFRTAVSLTLPDSCQSTWYQLCPLGWSRCNRGNRCMAKCGTRKRWQHGGVLQAIRENLDWYLLRCYTIFHERSSEQRLTMLTAFFESACLLLFWVLDKTWWRQSHDTQEPNAQGLRAQTMSKLQRWNGWNEADMRWIGESVFFGILCSIILVTEIHAPKLWTCTQSCAN